MGWKGDLETGREERGGGEERSKGKWKIWAGSDLKTSGVCPSDRPGALKGGRREKDPGHQEVWRHARALWPSAPWPLWC